MRKAAVCYALDRMKVSLWFVPLVMTFLAIILISHLDRLDAIIQNELLESSSLFIPGDPVDLRLNMLSVIETILVNTGVVSSFLVFPLSTMADWFISRLQHNPNEFEAICRGVSNINARMELLQIMV